MTDLSLILFKQLLIYFLKTDVTFSDIVFIHYFQSLIVMTAERSIQKSWGT